MASSEGSSGLNSAKEDEDEIIASIHPATEDRLSRLPENLTSQILSLVPTRKAIETILFSKDWNVDRKWKSIRRLEFDNERDITYRNRSTEELRMKIQKFTEYVNTVFTETGGSTLEKFRLNFNHWLGDDKDESNVNTWLHSALDRSVEDLDLILQLSKPLHFPQRTDAFECLAVLKLEGTINFSIPSNISLRFPSLHFMELREVIFQLLNSSVSFPKLKVLKFGCVIFANDASINQIFSSSPVLDQLEFVRRVETDDDLQNLVVDIPSLKRVRLSLNRNDNSPPLTVWLYTPGLQHLDMENICCESISASADNFNSLLEANVNVDENNNSITNLIMQRLQRVQFLSLSGHSLTAIRTSETMLSNFQNLTRINLENDVCVNWKVVIATLLPRMEFLEELSMKLTSRDLGWTCRGEHEPWWVRPNTEPSCLISRVTKIHVAGVNFCCRDELKLLKYLLKKSRVLQLLTIKCILPQEEMKDLSKRVSGFPKGSAECRVVIR